MSVAPLNVLDGVAASRVSLAAFFAPHSSLLSPSSAPSSVAQQTDHCTVPSTPSPPLLALGDGAAAGAVTAAEVAAANVGADMRATPTAAMSGEGRAEGRSGFPFLRNVMVM